MDFFEEEENQGPPQCEVTSPVPTRPFPFLKLPRELRNSIYSYAMVRPGTGPHVQPPAVCYMHHKAISRNVSTSYWGTAKSTRLFRVSHQVYEEATCLFYSTFSFHFPVTMDTALVNHTLGDTLNLNARRLIRKVGFRLSIRSVPHEFTAKHDKKPRLALEAMVKLLPNIQHVEASVAFSGRDVPEWQLQEVVHRILGILTPVFENPGLVVRGGFNENLQRAQILEHVREHLGCQRASS